MKQYEYRVLAAPNKGRKGPGIKGPEARFAHGLEQVINEQAAEGWEYLRSDILPSEERQGLTSSHTVYRSVLIFRRAIGEDLPLTAGVPATDEPEAVPEDLQEPDNASPAQDEPENTYGDLEDEPTTTTSDLEHDATFEPVPEPAEDPLIDETTDGDVTVTAEDAIEGEDTPDHRTTRT